MVYVLCARFSNMLPQLHRRKEFQEVLGPAGLFRPIVDYKP